MWMLNSFEMQIAFALGVSICLRPQLTRASSRKTAGIFIRLTSDHINRPPHIRGHASRRRPNCKRKCPGSILYANERPLGGIPRSRRPGTSLTVQSLFCSSVLFLVFFFFYTGSFVDKLQCIWSRVVITLLRSALPLCRENHLRDPLSYPCVRSPLSLVTRFLKRRHA